MSPLIVFALLLLAIFVIGMGLIRLFKIDLSYGLLIPISMITGVGIIAFVPFILQLFYVPITKSSVFTGIGVAAGLASIPSIWHWKGMQKPSWPRLRMYELPFLVLIGILIAISVWRCFYNPVAARDMLTGPEVIAQYAVNEHTMINSLFKVDLDINNNPFKPPSVTSLQIIYKLAGFPFGQVWLSILFISFTAFLYRVLTEKLHPVLAGILVLLFTAIPEVYSYTFLLLYDYSNMVFFTLSCYFLIAFYKSGERKQLLFSGFIMGLAVYFRAETLLFAGLLLPWLFFNLYKKQQSIKLIALVTVAFLAMPFISYYLPNELYNKYYLPLHYDAVNQINPHLSNIGALISRFWDMNKVLIFSDLGINLYGYFIYTFILLFTAQLFIKRQFSREAKNWLYCVALIYFGLPLLSHLIPLMDLTNTTKRGLFKVFPFMLFYMANNNFLLGLSNTIRNWEQREKKARPEVKAIPQKVNQLKHHQPKRKVIN